VAAYFYTSAFGGLGPGFFTGVDVPFNLARAKKWARETRSGGTYFGIKAGLDGQDKLKQTLARIDYGPRERPQDGTERSEDRTKKGRQAEEGQRAARDLQELGKGAYAQRRDWDGGASSRLGCSCRRKS